MFFFLDRSIKPLPVFQISGANFQYDGILAIRDLSLTVEAGERTVLLGANGSGKSTLLRMLDGLCFPSQGSITAFGDPLTQDSLTNPTFNFNFRRRVGLVFQNPDAQLFNPTVFEEVAYGPLQLKWTKEDLQRRVEETLDFMGISHLRERPPYRLSGGEKKRVALASVIVLDPDVLLLDEPTATLDPRSTSQLVDLIQQWKGSTKTVVTATQQLDIVEDIADRVLILQEGKILADGAPSEILSNTDLLLKTNLIHAHRHSHGGVVHAHPHLHRHSHDEHGH
jgi:cobalt/nickel transport system ATP-binding protein